MQFAGGECSVSSGSSSSTGTDVSDNGCNNSSNNNRGRRRESRANLKSNEVGNNSTDGSSSGSAAGLLDEIPLETDGELATVGGVIDLGPVEVSVSHDLNTQKTVGKLSLGPKLNTPVGSVKGGVYTDTTGVVGMEAAGSVGNTTIKGNVEASMKSVIDNISDIGAKINNAIRNKFYYK